MSYTVLTKGAHRCETPGIPEYHGLRRGAEIRCDECGQEWRLVFTFLSAFNLWRKVPRHYDPPEVP